jgi:hypothetical protein
MEESDRPLLPLPPPPQPTAATDRATRRLLAPRRAKERTMGGTVSDPVGRVKPTVDRRQSAVMRAIA